MKNTLFLLFAMPLFLMGQVTSYTAYVWGIRPDSICPGDSFTVLYKISPSVNVPTIPNINLTAGTNTIWSGTGSYLKSRPKEKWPTSPDSVFVLTIKTPTDLLVGNQLVRFNTQINSGPSTYSVTVKNCSCTISGIFTYTASDLSTTLTALGGNSTTTYYWDFGFGWQQGAAVQTYEFGSAGTYTVGLQVVNPTCQDDYFAPVTVSIAPTSTVGINEYSLDSKEPVYFDLYGNKTEKKTGVILIERRGTIFRKILIQ